MTKKIIAIAILMMTLLMTGCQGGDDNSVEEKNELGEYVFKGVITTINEKKYIEMDIIDSEVAFGTYRVLTDDDTKFYNDKGKEITRNDIKIGDVIEVVFSGQVMQSYPPQIYAQKVYLVRSK